MQNGSSSMVSEVRVASRDLVRQLGLMNQTVAGTDLSVSAVHAIIEINQTDRLSSKDLSEKLLLEKSTVSRLVKSLIKRGEVCEMRSEHDARVKHLSLTPIGNNTLQFIDRFAEAQVSTALDRLGNDAQAGILKGLQDYSSALQPRMADEMPDRSGAAVTIESGYSAPLIGRVLEMIVSHMNRHYGFGSSFEAKVATELAQFIGRLDSPQNSIWRALRGGEIVGSISIDGENLGNGQAHLRWFVVSNTIRGGGVGGALLDAAIEFCDSQGYHECHLWTVKGLDAARSLYERKGFVLAEEYRGDQWGDEVLEQKFVRSVG